MIDAPLCFDAALRDAVGYSNAAAWEALLAGLGVARCGAAKKTIDVAKAPA